MRRFFLPAVAALLVSSLGFSCPFSASDEKPAAPEIVVSLSEGEAPRCLDPHQIGDVISCRHTGMAYDCLLQYDPLKDSPQLMPCLATEVPWPGAGNLTYKFKLRDDVYFHDDRCFHADAKGKIFADEGAAMQSKRGAGRKLVASDLVYSFKRLAGHADSEGYWIVEGKIKMLDEFRQLSMKKWGDDRDKAAMSWYEFVRNCPVEGLKAPDDSTFVITLNQPYPQLLHAITLPYGAAVPFEAVEYYQNDLSTRAVGTGAFVLKSFDKESKIVWSKNPKYREEYFPKSEAAEYAAVKPLMGKRLPIADRVEYRIIREGKAAFEAFLKGEVDTTGVGKDEFARALTPDFKPQPELAKLGVTVTVADQPTLAYIAFNMNDPVVGAQQAKSEDEKKRARAIRRAIALCINREEHIKSQLNGRGTPADQLVPPGIFGYSELFKMSSQRLDPAEGRKALADVGFKVEELDKGRFRALGADGKQVSISILFRSNNDAAKAFAALLKTCGEKVGIEIKCELLTFREFLQRQNEGKGQAYDAGWVYDYPDAQNMFQLLYGPNKPPGINVAGYENPEFDKLYDEMALLLEESQDQKAKKWSAIKAMTALLDRDVPWVLVDFGKLVHMSNPWHLRPKPNSFAYSFGKYLWSDSAARAGAIEARKKG